MAASAVYLEAINSHFMKHLFLSLAALCAVTVGGWAQCTADFDFMGASFGISPNPLAGEAFADGFACFSAKVIKTVCVFEYWLQEVIKNLMF